MDQYFNNKVAVVTGAGGVICSRVAKDLAAEGMTVVLVGRTLEKLEKVAEEIEKDLKNLKNEIEVLDVDFSKDF